MTTSDAPALAGIRHLKLPVTDLAVHWASIQWILHAMHDPDGHEIRFYTIEQNAGPGPHLAAI
jgi:hypothetical protein